jgi:transforming growth factor-beta-induced protein
MASDPRFSNLLAAITAAGIALPDAPLTGFAPTNEAFAALFAQLELAPEEVLADIPLLEEVLAYHIIPVAFFAGDFVDGQVLPTLSGGELTVSIMDGKVLIGTSSGQSIMVAEADLRSGNGGVVHVINEVLLP